jgi:heme/copper-type cytochrome/quinol oxidase subunit 2
LASPPRRRRRLVALLLGVLAFALLASPAHASLIAPEAPHSPNADDMSTAYWVTFVVTVLVAVALIGGLLAAVIRFRDTRGRVPARTVAGRGAMLRLTAPFAVLAAALFVFGIITTHEARTIETDDESAAAAAPVQLAQVGVKGAPPAPPVDEAAGADPTSEPIRIRTIGQQWLWRFEYPGNEPQGQRIFSYGELVVPVDATVILEVTSTDVVHRWWVPALGGQVDAVPGKFAETWFRADEEGLYEGRSTAYSGTAYPSMRAWVRVVSESEYEAHLQQLEDDLRAAQEAVERAEPAAGAGGGQ